DGRGRAGTRGVERGLPGESAWSPHDWMTRVEGEFAPAPEVVTWRGCCGWRRPVAPGGFPLAALLPRRWGGGGRRGSGPSAGRWSRVACRWVGRPAGAVRGAGPPGRRPGPGGGGIGDVARGCPG